MTDQTFLRTHTDRLATIRRLYFYLVAFISLVAGLSAAGGLIEILIPLWLAGETLLDANASGFVRDAIALPGGFLIVSAPIFLIHWQYIRRLAARPGESFATLRKLFIYATLAVTLTVSATALYQLIEGSLELLFGNPLAESDLWPSRWLVQLIHAAVHLPLFLFFVRQLQADGDFGTELGWAGVWRRLFQMLVGLVGIGLLITGAAGALEFAWRALLGLFTETILTSAGSGWWQSGIAGTLTNVLIGGLIWRLNSLSWNTLMTAQPPEGRMALRRLYLYAATVLSAVVALVPVALLLRLGTLFLLGAAESVDIDIGDLTMPLGLLPVGAFAWRWHWGQISAEALRYGDSGESELVRRLYYYSVAATGLVLLWIGVVDLLRALLDFAIVDASVEKGFRAEQLANGLSLIAVGAPVWSIHWRTAQHAGAQAGAAGRAERGSWPRRAYLYGIALIGALLMLFELAQVGYRLLLWALGDPNADPFGAETLDGLVRAGAASVFWILHILTIRTDSRLTDEDVVAQDEDRSRRAELIARIEHLEVELSALRAELADMQDEEPPAEG